MLHLNRSISLFSRLALCSVAIGACTISHIANAQEPAKLPEGVAASVNGSPIPLAMIRLIEQQTNNTESKPSREEILSELINLELLTQTAEMQELENQPDVAAQLRLQYSQTMANAYLGILAEELAVSEEEVRAEFDKQIQLATQPEYHASHILLESEEDAIDVIAALDADQDFATLASERSTGPSANSGGDLGWFDNGTMMEEFTEAVASLEIDEYTRTPVQTDFGWHVILLKGTRIGKLPDFESVEPGLRNLMVTNLIHERVAELREAAEIQRVE